MTTYNIVLTPNVDTDQSTSLQTQINAIPDGTVGNRNIIYVPKGRYRRDYALDLGERKHLLITPQNPVSQYPTIMPSVPDWNEFFTTYTDKSPADLGLSSRSHFIMRGCTDVEISFCAVDGPYSTLNPTNPLYADFQEAQSTNHGFSITSSGSLAGNGYSIGSQDCGYSDCYAIHVGGDGFIFTALNEPTFNNVSVNCFVRRCQAYYASRHGMTASSGEGTEVTDYYSNWNGDRGIDIEPNIDKGHCWDATFTRMSVGGFRGSFQGAGSNSDLTYARKKNLQFTDCVGLGGQTNIMHISGTQSGPAANAGYCIIEGFNNGGSTSVIGITATGFDDVVIDGCVCHASTSSSATYAIQAEPSNSLTITNNIFNGFTEGFDQLYSALGSEPPNIIHYGNVWAKGTQNDGTGPIFTRPVPGESLSSLPTHTSSIETVLEADDALARARALGTAILSGGATTMTLTSAFTMASAAYQVVLEPSWMTTWAPTSKTTTGLSAAFGVPCPTGGGTVNWRVAS